MLKQDARNDMFPPKSRRTSKWATSIAQHLRNGGPLLISSSLQTNDNESRQYSRIIMLQKKSQHLPCSPQLECKTRRGHNKSVATEPVCPWLTERNIIEISLLSHFRRKTVTCTGECDKSAQNLRCGIGREQQARRQLLITRRPRAPLNETIS